MITYEKVISQISLVVFTYLFGAARKACPHIHGVIRVGSSHRGLGAKKDPISFEGVGDVRRTQSEMSLGMRIVGYKVSVKEKATFQNGTAMHVDT